MMWLRLAGLAAAAFGVMAALDGVGLIGEDAPAPSEIAHGRWRELFWLLVFAFTMTSAVWVAGRRQAERVKRVAVRISRRR